MRETKLYQAIVQLNGFELNRLHRFILSPYFNRNESIINLFEWIKQDLKNQQKSAISKENLWTICFGNNQKFNDGRLRKLQSDLLSLIEEFYAQEAYEANPVHKTKYLLESIIENDLEDLQASALRSAQKLIDEQPILSSSYYYYQYEIEKSIYRFHQKHTERRHKSNIEQIAQNLDHFYLGEKLKYYCSILSQKLTVELNYDLLFMQEIIKHIEEHDYSNIPSIIIYFQIFKMYQEPQEREHYDKLKILINKYIKRFPEIEAKEIVDAALNYSMDKINAGKKEFVRETFNLYLDSLENKVVLIKGRISPWSFKNIVTAGLRLSEFDWVEKFIYEYSEKLEERFRENALTFNLAQLSFYRRDYPKVISQLSKVDYEDITYNLNSKTLLMASYYELDEIEALNALLDTFRVYLSRNQKVPAYRRTHYLTTINIVRKLARIKQGDLVNINKLVSEVNKAKGIVSKNWILEKLAALKS